MYKYLLFDADNTLLDFDTAEKQALRETLSASPLGFSDEIHSRYHIINDNEWKKLERGETTREKLAVERFVRLYDEFGMDGNENTELPLQDCIPIILHTSISSCQTPKRYLIH